MFETDDWVWIHMRKEHFSKQCKSKLIPRGDGLFQVIWSINNNAYQLDLAGKYNINVADLSPYFTDSVLRTNLFEEEENDADIICDMQHSMMIEAPKSPMTRAHAK